MINRMKSIKKKIETVANKQEKVAEEQEKIINKVKELATKRGIVKKSPKIKVVDKNFAGKTLKISKGFYKDSNQHTLKAGTKWEEIDAFFRKHINFTIKDFNN